MFIKTGSLERSLDIINRLELTLGGDCTIHFNGVSITAPLNQRIDHDIILTPDQCNQLTGIGIRFNADLERAGDDVNAQIDAAIAYGKAKAQMRWAIVTPLAESIMAQSPSQLIYKSQYPDGRSYFVRSLIHLTHPASPEELWLREHRVTAKSIYRFHVVGLDDAEWDAQNEPRREWGDRVWRELLLGRSR
jgi:hypothetical protein